MLIRCTFLSALAVLGFSTWKCAASSPGDISANGDQSSFFSNSCISMAMVCGLIGLIIGVAAPVVYICTCGKRKYTFLQNEKKDEELDDMVEMVSTLKEVKTKLENQRDQLKGQLEEVETEKEKNKKKLQSVKTEITEREKSFDKPEDLLRQKENLLQVQWKLDETKKNCERQILNMEKLLESIEIQATRTERKKNV